MEKVSHSLVAVGEIGVRDQLIFGIAHERGSSSLFFCGLIVPVLPGRIIKVTFVDNLGSCSDSESYLYCSKK